MANQIRSCPALAIEKKRTVLIKPSKPTPSESLSLSTIDNDPYNEAMYRTIYVYQANRNHNTGPRDPASVLMEGLSRVLVYYYPLAGKLKKRSSDGKLQLTCTAEGVPFVVASASCELSSVNYLDGVDYETALQLSPDYDVSHESDSDYHPATLQVTTFSCGGFAVVLMMTHSICDAFGAAYFFRALAELASGKTEPTVKPVWERERLVGEPNDEPLKIPGGNVGTLGVSPYKPTNDMVREIINVTSDTIKGLKSRLMKDKKPSEEIFFTTFEVLGAYVWRSRVKSLKLNSDGTTLFGFPVGIRNVLNPPLSKGYYGNAVMDVYGVLTVKELIGSPLSETAKAIKEAKQSVSCNEKIKKELANMEKLWKINLVDEERKDGLVYLTDWRNLGLYGLADFGWRDAVNVIPVVPIENLYNLWVLLPPSKLDPSMEGGVRVMMTLPRAAMDEFKEQMDALKWLGDNDAAGA